ncbi:hypothetical protein ID0109_03300 [Helicobacter pylori]
MKIKTIVMSLLISGSLLLGSDIGDRAQQLSNDYNQRAQEFANEVDLSTRESQRQFVMFVLSLHKTLIDMHVLQEMLTNKIKKLEAEVAQLEKQPHKPNHDKK